MSISARIHDTLEGWSVEWKDRLRGWMIDWLMGGIKSFLEDSEPGAKDLMSGTLRKIIDNPNTSPELKQALQASIERGDWVATAFGYLGMVIGSIIGIMAIGGPPGRVQSYAVDRITQSFRLDPLSVINAWRRDPASYEKLFDDLRDQGFDEDRIKALEFVTQAMPTPRDIVGFLAHEVFEKDMIDKYKLLSEWNDIDKEFAKKIGVEEDILKLYWMDHWEHPGWTTIQELRHRDLITDQDVKDWHKVVEIPEYWRPMMLESLWSLPNRIEIRMMARYLDMSKEDIMSLLGKAGLHPDYRSDAADFMLIMGLTGYWSSMLSNGWMSPADVKADIEAKGLKPVTADRIYKKLVKQSQPEKVSQARDLTVAQIIRWVKLDEAGRRSQGIELLVDLNYSEPQAIFIMEGYLGEMGSPETYEDFKDLTTKYKIAIGKEERPMPLELKAAAAELVKVAKDIEALQESIKEEKAKLIDVEPLPKEATKRLDKLQVELHRAEAEKERRQTEYDKKLAEWRRGG